MWGSFTKYSFISEGDSPAFLHLMDVGLNNLDNPSYGGWGGRLVQSATDPSRWEDGEHVVDFNPYSNQFDKAYPQTRWIDVLQNEFAARADWCVLPYSEANHPPVVDAIHSGPLKAKPGSKLKLSSTVKDPDGNKIEYKWWQYHEVDTYAGKLTITDDDKPSISLTIPSDTKTGDTIHVILSATDSGTPPLTRYGRVVIEIVK
jgi:hypothetical protein